MGKKGKKEKRGKGAEKTATKTEKNMEKKHKKMLQETGEDDIESLIAEFKEQDKKRAEVFEEKCGPPSPRCNLALVPHPEKEELIMFGGEYFNGKKTHVYNDLFHYNLKSEEWTSVKVPNSPPPRCSHQMVSLKQGGGQLWLFGGEFASPSQNQFYHYKDLWVYHIREKRWEAIKAPGGPSARSGHRMVVYKKMLIVFGGFHDNTREYKYFNDVYGFSLEDYTWTKLNPSGNAPGPRSGHVMAVTENAQHIVIYGGYSKIKVKREVDKGHRHTDMYILAPDGKTKSESVSTEWKWQPLKQSGVRPTERCGCTLVATPGNRAVLFGGVFDEEEDDENVKGKFFNDMYSLELDKGKWHEVQLRGSRDNKERKRRRKVKESGANGEEEDESGSDSDSADIDEEVSKKLKVNEEPSSPDEAPAAAVPDSVFTVTVAGPSASVFAATGTTQSKSEDLFVPHPRMNPVLTVRNGVLYLFGGLYEDGDRQFTLQDFYSLDLHKLEKWETIISSDLAAQEWLGSDSSDDEGAAGGDSDDDEMDVDAPPIESGEDLDTYFARTTDFWIEQAEDIAKEEGIAVSDKQLNKAAKNMAKEYYEEET